MVLLLPSEARQAIVRHAQWCLPEEACGLLAGPAPDRVRMVYPLENVQHSRTAYTIDPVGHFRAMRHAERSGWALIGAFHSHPESDPVPSPTDIRLSAEPGWVHLIVSRPDRPSPVIRAFRIIGTGSTEVTVLGDGTEA